MLIARAASRSRLSARSHHVAARIIEPSSNLVSIFRRVYRGTSCWKHRAGSKTRPAYFRRDHNSAIIDSQSRLHTEANTCKMESRQDRLTRFLHAISRSFRVGVNMFEGLTCPARVRCLTVRDISRISLCLSFFIYLSIYLFIVLSLQYTANINQWFDR